MPLAACLDPFRQKLTHLTSSSCRSPFALPTLLVAAPAAFYAVLFATGHTLADARAAGWVSKPQASRGHMLHCTLLLVFIWAGSATLYFWQWCMLCCSIAQLFVVRMCQLLRTLDPAPSTCLPLNLPPQPGDSEWRFWRAWSLYNIHDFPPSNIHWAALPGQVRAVLQRLDSRPRHTHLRLRTAAVPHARMPHSPAWMFSPHMSPCMRG